MAKIAIITGATRGIGKSIAEQLFGENYDVVISARNEEELKEVKESLQQLRPGGQVYTGKLDLTQEEQILPFASHVLENIGTPHILVNNIGGYVESNLLGESKLAQMLSLNLVAPYVLTRSLLPSMLKTGEGFIFNIGSVLCKEVRPEATDYTIAKHALYAFHKTLVEQVREHGIKCSIILPGSVNTSSWNKVNAPKHEFVQADDIASIVLNALKVSANAFMEEITVKPLNSNY